MSMDGYTFVDDSFVAINEAMTVSCYAIGGRPATNITWHFDGPVTNVKEIYLHQYRNENDSWSTTSTVQFVPTGVNGTLYCSYSLTNTDVVQQIQTTYNTYGKKMGLQIPILSFKLS